MRIKAPVFRIWRKCAPLVNDVLRDFAKARMVESDAGTKITLDELQQLGLEVGFRVGSIVAKELGRANADIIDGDFYDGS